MVYDYKCPECGTVEEKEHSMKESPEFTCKGCGAIMKRLISMNASGFYFRIGTTTTNVREKEKRKKRSVEMKERMTRSGNIRTNVKPNIAGVETSSWSDAQKLAKESGLNHESYSPWVEKEKKGKIILQP